MENKLKQNGLDVPLSLKNAVTALHALGYKVLRVCEGQSQPLIADGEVIDDMLPSLLLTTEELQQVIAPLSSGINSQSEPDFDEMMRHFREVLMVAMRRFMEVLDKFYQSRNVPASQRLIISQAEQGFMVQSQAVVILALDNDTSARTAVLPALQKELQDLGDFIKKEYFGDEYLTR